MKIRNLIRQMLREDLPSDDDIDKFLGGLEKQAKKGDDIIKKANDIADTFSKRYTGGGNYPSTGPLGNNLTGDLSPLRKILDGAHLIDENNRWVTGIHQGKYIVEACIYNEPSQYGIDGGRISKLWVGDLKSTRVNPKLLKPYDVHKTLLNYDRGWDVPPANGELVQLLHALMMEIDGKDKWSGDTQNENIRRMIKTEILREDWVDDVFKDLDVDKKLQSNKIVFELPIDVLTYWNDRGDEDEDEDDIDDQCEFLKGFVEELPDEAIEVEMRSWIQSLRILHSWEVKKLELEEANFERFEGEIQPETTVAIFTVTVSGPPDAIERIHAWRGDNDI